MLLNQTAAHHSTEVWSARITPTSAAAILISRAICKPTLLDLDVRGNMIKRAPWMTHHWQCLQQQAAQHQQCQKVNDSSHRGLLSTPDERLKSIQNCQKAIPLVVERTN